MVIFVHVILSLPTSGPIIAQIIHILTKNGQEDPHNSPRSSYSCDITGYYAPWDLSFELSIGYLS